MLNQIQGVLVEAGRTDLAKEIVATNKYGDEYTAGTLGNDHCVWKKDKKGNFSLYRIVNSKQTAEKLSEVMNSK